MLSKKFGQVPHSLLVSLMNSLIHLSKHLEVKNEIADDLLAQSLFSALKNSIPSNTLTIHLLKCILSFISNENFQEQGFKTDLNSIILNGLKSSTFALKLAMDNFIILTSVYPKFVEEYINHGIIEYLTGNDRNQLLRINWSAAIKSILRSNLSIKFAHRYFLDFDDDIKDGFYVSRNHFINFKILWNIMNEDCSPRFPVFFVHFNNKISKNLESSKVSTNSCELCYSKSPLDLELPEYVLRIQERFSSEMQDEMKYKIIAEFVCEEISSCTKHELDFHLNELKVVSCSMGQMRRWKQPF